MREPERFFFVHVQKTAGTALLLRLMRVFSEREMYPGPGDGSQPDNTLIVEDLLSRWGVRRDEIRIVTGHFPLCTIELLGGPFRTFTILRDPVERILSALRHQAQLEPAFANASLEDIYDEPVRNQLFRNHMVKMFSLTPEEMDASALTHVDFTPERLERAKERLAAVDVVGVQEEFEPFCNELSHRFGWDLGSSLRANRTRPMEADPGLRRRLAEENADDIALYEFACELVGRRTA